MCNKMYENVKSLDYTKKFLRSDSDPATMEVVTRTNAVKSPTSSPETTKLVYTVKEVAQMLAISQRAALFEPFHRADKKKNQNTNVFWFFLVRWKGLEPPAY